MIEPFVILSSPPIKFNNVDLPLPLLPKTNTNPLFGKVIFILSYALHLLLLFDLYIFVKLLILIIMHYR